MKENNSQKILFSVRNQKAVKRFRSVIERNYRSPGITVDHLARESYMSVRNLQRVIKQLHRQTPMQYLKEYRLIQSLDLLNKGLLIDDIIIKIGFVSHNNFIRSFKEKFSITPKQYQIKNRYKP